MSKVTQKCVLTAELLRWGVRAYGVGTEVVLIWYWRSGHVQSVESFPWTACSLSQLRNQCCEGGYSMLSKGSRPSAKDSGSAQVQDEAFAKKYPTLFDYLTQTKWDDGTSRVTATLMIFAQDGLLKGMLRDRDAEQTLWVAADGFEKLLKLMDKAASDPDAEWRLERSKPGDTAKRSGGGGRKK